MEEEALSPYTDFPTWSCILLACLEPDSGYGEFLPDCTALISTLIDNKGRFPPPLADHTDAFIHETLPAAVSQVLTLPGSDPDVIAFVDSVVRLGLWAFAAGRRDFDSVLHDISLQFPDSFTQVDCIIHGLDDHPSSAAFEFVFGLLASLPANGATDGAIA
jgi:hypothetical protein